MTLKDIEKRVVQSAEDRLFRQGYVSVLDILIGIEFLQPLHVQDWKKGRVPYLEKVVRGNLHKISHAMKCFRKWAVRKTLKPSETVYQAKTRGPKRTLQFSKTNHPSIEKAYQTHYVSPLLLEKKKEKLKKPPDVWEQETFFRERF